MLYLTKLIFWDCFLFPSHDRAGADGMLWSDMQKNAPYSKHKPKDLKEILQSLKDADLVYDETYVYGRGRPTVKWAVLK